MLTCGCATADTCASLVMALHREPTTRCTHKHRISAGLESDRGTGATLPLRSGFTRRSQLSGHRHLLVSINIREHWGLWAGGVSQKQKAVKVTEVVLDTNATQLVRH